LANIEDPTKDENYYGRSWRELVEKMHYMLKISIQFGANERHASKNIYVASVSVVWNKS